MKPIHNFFTAGVILIACALGVAVAKDAAPAKVSRAKTGDPTTNAVPRSVFSLPSATVKGRDPFFPNLQPKAQPVIHTNAPAAPVVTLVYHGYSGGANKIASISGHAFAEGEDANVNTPGGRVHVRCIEIHEEFAIVEINGERRELRLKGK